MLVLPPLDIYLAQGLGSSRRSRQHKQHPRAFAKLVRVWDMVGMAGETAGQWAEIGFGFGLSQDGRWVERARWNGPPRMDKALGIPEELSRVCL